MAVMEKKTLEKALSVMGMCSPAIAVSWLLRSGEPKLVDAVYNRRFLHRIGHDRVISLFEEYLECFDQLLEKNNDNNPPHGRWLTEAYYPKSYHAFA